MFFYTFRRVSLFGYQVTKWEEFRSEPVETYDVTWKQTKFCNCYTRMPWCKHIEMLQQMIESSCIDEHWLWYHDDNGWQTAHDQMENFF